MTYARIVVDFRPQKTDPNRVRIIVGGNLIDYPYELTTRTADLTTSKVMWNSVISTPGAKYACADVKSFYLMTPLDRFEYMQMRIDLVPQELIVATLGYRRSFTLCDGLSVIMAVRYAIFVACRLLSSTTIHAYVTVHSPGMILISSWVM